MQYVPVDRLLDKTGSIYKLAVLVAMRAIELHEGAAKLVETSSDAKVINIALQEILEGKISYKPKEKK